MKKIIILICVLLMTLAGHSQFKLYGNGGRDIQTFKHYLNSGSDSVARFAKWGAKFFTSVTLLKDSVQLVGSATSESIVLLDTTTGKTKRIKASALFSQTQRDSVGYYTITGTTSDATPTVITTVEVPVGYIRSIEATCIAITGDGDDGYSGIKHRAFHKTSGGTLTSMAQTVLATDSYVGGGLTTATFTLTNSGTNASIQVTGEAGTTIHWKIRYKLLSENVSF